MIKQNLHILNITASIASFFYLHRPSSVGVHPLLAILLISLLASCKQEPEAAPEPTPIDPCVITPGTILSFGDLIYEYDEQGWPVHITTNDQSTGNLGSNYQIYRYGGGIMTYTELSLDNGNFWAWDSLVCNGSTCTHYYEQSDTACPTTGSTDPCEFTMTLNIGNWVLSDGATLYHYNPNYVLDSITSPEDAYHFYYFQGRISKILEFNNLGDTIATQHFTYNADDQWRAFERLDHQNGKHTLLQYIYDTDGRITMVSVGTGIPPITLMDYPAVQEGCGEAPRALDPLNKYRLPHMKLTYIGLPW